MFKYLLKIKLGSSPEHLKYKKYLRPIGRHKWLAFFQFNGIINIVRVDSSVHFDVFDIFDKFGQPWE